jgi:two-component system KDP operon response regulator KdpE
MYHILIIEDEPAIRTILRAVLGGEGYSLIEADTGARAEIEARKHKPDVLLLDLGLPDIDGVTIIRHVREWSPVPIIVLSARTTEDQKIAALDAGADDYITKPFSAPELLARVRAGLRRNARDSDHISVLNLGPVQIDLTRRICHGPRGPIHLTNFEYLVLGCLARQTGLVVQQSQLLREVWGPDGLDDARNLRVCIRNLRNKLESNPSRPRYLVTETGLGYRLWVDGGAA